MVLDILRLCLLLVAAECSQPDKLYVTVYTPAMGGVNCYLDCDTNATGAYVPNGYGVMAACPKDWVKLPWYRYENGEIQVVDGVYQIGGWTTTAVVIDGRMWYCLDNFGHPINQEPRWLDFDWMNDGDFFLRVDLQDWEPYSHPYNNTIWEEWHIIEYVPVPKELWPPGSY